jgi:hypothetical protein
MSFSNPRASKERGGDGEAQPGLTLGRGGLEREIVDGRRTAVLVAIGGGAVL